MARASREMPSGRRGKNFNVILAEDSRKKRTDEARHADREMYTPGFGTSAPDLVLSSEKIKPNCILKTLAFVATDGYFKEI